MKNNPSSEKNYGPLINPVALQRVAEYALAHWKHYC